MGSRLSATPEVGDGVGHHALRFQTQETSSRPSRLPAFLFSRSDSALVDELPEQLAAFWVEGRGILDAEDVAGDIFD